MFREKGQINIIGLLGLGATISIFAIGTFLANSYRSDSKIDSVKVDVSANASNIATLTEAINTLKSDNAEIKKDLKEIIKILR